jgi:GLPGLI family protein
MKTKIILLFILYFYSTQAQEKFVASYDVYPTFDLLQKEEDIKDKSLSFLYDGVDETLKEELKYKLEFNSLESLFVIIPVESQNPKSYKLAKSFAGSFDVYSHKNALFKVKKVSFIGDSFFVNDSTTYNWVIHNEKRIIDGKTCFKATTENHVLIKKKIKTYEVIAWFCTEFPGFFGPKGYNGLPGLILELTDDKVTFVCSRVEKEKGTIENYENEKIISKEEFDKIVQKARENAGF